MYCLISKIDSTDLIGRIGLYSMNVCATCFELPSTIGTMVGGINEPLIHIVYKTLLLADIPFYINKAVINLGTYIRW